MLVNMFVENNQLTDREIAQLREILHRAEEKKRSSSEQS